MKLIESDRSDGPNDRTDGPDGSDDAAYLVAPMGLRKRTDGPMQAQLNET